MKKKFNLYCGLLIAAIVFGIGLTMVQTGYQMYTGGKAGWELAKKAYTASDCRGLSRVDFFVRKDGKILINEINTLPGFTNISMYPKLMQYMGMTYPELIDGIISLALKGEENER